MYPDHFGIRELFGLLDGLGIAYFVCGSVASSVHGVPRATMDIDIVADLRSERIREFVEATRANFYVDEETIRAALLRGRSFNLIHLKSAYKFDIFPLLDDSYQRAQFERRANFQSSLLTGDPISLTISSAEDTILMKLVWYRAGQEQSERQWSDLKGILAVQQMRLDLAYLRQWAAYLKVGDLLEKVLADL